MDDIVSNEGVVEANSIDEGLDDIRIVSVSLIDGTLMKIPPIEKGFVKWNVCFLDKYHIDGSTHEWLNVISY